MMDRIAFVVIIGTIVYFVLKIYELVCDLSDDINEIKKKLGLGTYTRTSMQRKREEADYISHKILWGSSLKNIRKERGFWFTFKYKDIIDLYIKKYSNGEGFVCPKCLTMYGEGDFEAPLSALELLNPKCIKCEITLIKINKFKEELLSKKSRN